MKPWQDDEIVEQAPAGDWGAKMIVDRFEGSEAGFVKTIPGPGPEAQDVGQKVFIRFFESLELYRGEASLGTNLSRSAMNLSLNELKYRRRAFFFFSSDEKTAHHQSITEGPDMGEALQLAFQHLTPEFRSVATLRLVERYSAE
jgi:RNA polymerase sigma-70 factor (ECF subfamily)